MNYLYRGLTLIELLTTIAILSLTLTLAMPSLSSFSSKNRISTHLNILARAITLARESAITLNSNVTLCRSNDQFSCQGQWDDGMILFVDNNSDRTINDDDYYLQKFETFPNGDRIIWRAFGNRQYLQMKPSGFTRFQNGTFTYCPREGLSFARGIILNAAGRLRFTKDSDGDGFNEGASGRRLRC